MAETAQESPELFRAATDLESSIANLKQKLERERRAWFRLEHEYDIEGEPSYITSHKKAVTHDSHMTDAAFAELNDVVGKMLNPAAPAEEPST